MKKVFFTVLAAAALSSALFAADKKKQIEFSNELSSDLIHHIAPKNSNRDSHTSFAGLTENVKADYNGDIVKVGADANLYMKDPNGTWNDDDGQPFYITEWDADWYVEFNPFKVVGFGFSDELYTEGSLLPVWDSNVNAGNYSTNGFAVLIRPIKELSFGAGFDVPAAWFGDDGNAYELALGVDYNSDPFSIGGSLRHIGTDDHFQLGVYASIKAIDKLKINVGFTHSEDGNAGLGNVTFVSPYNYWDGTSSSWVSFLNAEGIYGENILTGGVVFDAGNFQILGDLAFNFDTDYSYKGYWWNINGTSVQIGKGGYDFYTAVEFKMELTKVIGLDIKGLALFDFGDETVLGTNGWRDLDPTFGVYPKVVFTLNDHHTLYAGIIVQSCTDSDYGYTEFALPVGWKYTY
ncbi:MAG: hypothetical protein IKO57_02375 [Treponema sp.]|nr:hypothetical protein [Treponema sp.]MBR6913166.1 hypothetical protein [Treponema sp.]